MSGFFFSESAAQDRIPLSVIPKCGACGLYKGCLSPKMPVTGKGRKGILIVGEAPGREEDKQNKQFVGETGQLLQDTLRRMDVEMRRDCWITNALICRPERNFIKNEAWVDFCRPNLMNTIQKLQPERIILLGARAVRSLIGAVFNEEKVGGITKWAGFIIPSRKPNAWVCPTFHPSFVKRAEDMPIGKVISLWWKRHLEAAIQIKPGRPWTDEELNKDPRISIELDPDRAATRLKVIMAFGKPMSFDYETNMLKPDSDKARIVSCAVSNGTDTLAFPWFGYKIVLAMKEFLLSKVKKIGANIPFEHRWSLKFVGCNVRNWLHDDMLCSHVLDNRPGITGVKFQSYALFGQEDYSSHIKSYFESETTNTPNRIKEVPLEDLLFYNGKDALLEWQIAMKQREVLGL